MSDKIDRLRLAAEDAAGGPASAEQVDALIALVDALEAELAARQPTEDDREVAMSAAREGLMSSYTDHWPDIQAQIVDAILAAGFSRAAVPDAAPEGQVIIPSVRVRELREALNEARAERDAALAAIERVRAVCGDAERIKVRNREWRKLSGRASTSTHDPIPGLKEVLAALDGAPEPEVIPVEGEPSGDPHEMSEHSVVAYHEWRNILGRDHLSDDEGTAARIAFYAGWDHARAVTPEPDWEYGLRTRSKHDPARGFFSYAGDLETAWEMYGATYEHCTATIVRRRKAGPWEPLPAEGEKP